MKTDELAYLVCVVVCLLGAVGMGGNEGSEFRLVVENFQVRVFEAPVEVRIAGGHCATKCFESVDFHPQKPVSAGSVVKNVGVGWAHGHGDLNVHERGVGFSGAGLI